jgi:hypothetical protein
LGNLGDVREVVVGAGTVDAQARSRNIAEAVTKFSPKICVAHCSGVLVLCVWPKGVMASYLELAIWRKALGDVKAVV